METINSNVVVEGKSSMVTKVIFPVGDGNTPYEVSQYEVVRHGDEGHIPRRGWKQAHLGHGNT